MAANAMNVSDLIAFEDEVSARFEAKEIRGPIHLCSPSQAEPLIQIFRDIKRTDWVLSNWRSHWHALLHGIPRDRVMAEIVAGRSMMLHFPEYQFMTSAIVGGMLPIACGLAAGGERVWVFCGDMAQSAGAWHDAHMYAQNRDLPVTFVTEDNGLSTNSPTHTAWGVESGLPVNPLHYSRYYTYKRTTQHCGTDNYVSF